MRKTAELERLVKAAQQRLNLNDWLIKIEVTEFHSGSDQEDIAQTNMCSKYRTCTMTFSPRVLGFEQPRFNEVILHELHHLVMADAFRSRDESVELLLSTLREALSLRNKREEEIAVTRITRLHNH